MHRVPKRDQGAGLEKGVDPELVAERISELRGEEEALEEALAEIGAKHEEAEPRSCLKRWRGCPT